MCFGKANVVTVQRTVWGRVCVCFQAVEVTEVTAAVCMTEEEDSA